MFGNGAARRPDPLESFVRGRRRTGGGPARQQPGARESCSNWALSVGLTVILVWLTIVNLESEGSWGRLPPASSIVNTQGSGRQAEPIRQQLQRSSEGRKQGMVLEVSMDVSTAAAMTAAAAMSVDAAEPDPDPAATGSTTAEVQPASAAAGQPEEQEQLQDQGSVALAQQQPEPGSQAEVPGQKRGASAEDNGGGAAAGEPEAPQLRPMFPQAHPCCNMRGIPTNPEALPADCRCLCTALYSGDRCEQPQTLAGGPMKAPFKPMPPSVHIALNQEHVYTMRSMVIATPLRRLEILPELSQAMKHNLSQAVPPADPLKTAFFQTCAIVGSSAGLLHREQGAEIDANEMVVRFNKAPTQGYEAFVGRKTTLRISNGEHLGWREGSEPVIHHLRSRSFLMRFLVFAALFPDQTPLLFDPGITEEVGQLMGPSIPSSGIAGIVMALQMCAKVSLYGFATPTEYGVRTHYYNNEVPANTARDNDVYGIISFLEDNGLLHVPDVCIRPCKTRSKDECFQCYGGEAAFAQLLKREAWTRQQHQQQRKRERDWDRFQVWKSGMRREWVMDDAAGVHRIRAPRKQRKAVPPRTRSKSKPHHAGSQV